MGRRHRAVACAVVLLAACAQPDRQTDIADPEVQELFAVAAKVDLRSVGFSAPPASGSIRIYKKQQVHAVGNDAGLLAEGEGGSRNWFFNRAGEGYSLACASETIRGTRTWQRSDVTGGRPYQEALHINYVAENAGVCGSSLKPGVSGIHWGPNGIEQVDAGEVLRLRAEIQKSR